MKLKSKKSALLLSFTSLLLCFAMLAGSTFAWFTDTATTGVNKIVAGKLKVDIVDATNTDKSLTGDNGKLLWTQKVVSGSDGELKAVETEGLPLWEPGVTFLTQGFKIKNGGNLALKWKMAVNKENVENGKADSEETPSKSLLDVIDFSVVKSTDENATAVAIENFVGELKEKNTVSTDTYYIKGHMQKEAGNDYQNLTLDGITITVYATQLNHENDSFGPDYDETAPLPLVATRNGLNTTITRDSLKDAEGKIAPVEVTLGNLEAEDIVYDERDTGYTGKGVMLGSTNLNKYAAAPAAAGEYKFTFKDGTITSTATGYGSIDNYKNTSVYMLVPGNSDVVFENMTFNGVVSFDIQKYTSPWSNLNSISFKNCIFNGIIIGTCPASNVTFDGCTFNAYTNTDSANNSNPIWWREDTEGSGANANPIETFTFVNNKVTGTRPVKIERIGKTVSPIFTIKNNIFDISAQAGDTKTKNMAINIGMGEHPNLPFTLIDEGNTISANTAALYTASLTGGSNWYKETSGMKVLDGNGNNKVITAMVWKTTTGETFKLKTVD